MPERTAYRFGPYRLSIKDRILDRDGQRIQLTPKVVDTLFVLVENAGQVVTKEELMKAVWPDVVVVESGLTRNLSNLRKALEEGSGEGSFIETIPRRGYRFVAPVQEEFREEPDEPAPAAAPPPPPRRRFLWPGVALAVVVTAAAIGFFLKLGRDRSAPPVDPATRIGEHLLYKLAPEETIRAAEHFERAVAANPDSARAHAGLAISLLQLSTLGVQSLPEVLPRAEPAARKAIDLDPASSAAQYSAGMVSLFKDWDFAAAEPKFRRALQLDPESVQVRLGYARLKLATADLDQAQQLVEEALALDPASPPLGTMYCCLFYYRRDFRRAEAECRKVLDREPGYALAHYYLALTLGFLGALDEAGKSLDRSGLMPGVVEADRAWLRLLQGDRVPAAEVLEQRRSLINQQKIDTTAKLLPATILGNLDEAYEALESGIRTRAPELLTLAIDPRLAPLRNDPRYSSVARRIGVSP